MLIANLTGRLTKDAEIRNAGSSVVCGFSVASNEKIKGEERVTFVDCSMWGKRGESVQPYLKKGTPVAVAGKLSTREHNGKTYLQVEVDQLELMGSKPGARNESVKTSAGDQRREDDENGIPF